MGYSPPLASGLPEQGPAPTASPQVEGVLAAAKKLRDYADTQDDQLDPSHEYLFTEIAKKAKNQNSLDQVYQGAIAGQSPEEFRQAKRDVLTQTGISQLAPEIANLAPEEAAPAAQRATMILASNDQDAGSYNGTKEGQGAGGDPLAPNLTVVDGGAKPSALDRFSQPIDYLPQNVPPLTLKYGADGTYQWNSPLADSLQADPASRGTWLDPDHVKSMMPRPTLKIHNTDQAKAMTNVMNGVGDETSVNTTLQHLNDADYQKVMGDLKALMAEQPVREIAKLKRPTDSQWLAAAIFYLLDPRKAETLGVPMWWAMTKQQMDQRDNDQAFADKTNAWKQKVALKSDEAQGALRIAQANQQTDNDQIQLNVRAQEQRLERESRERIANGRQMTEADKQLNTQALELLKQYGDEDGGYEKRANARNQYMSIMKEIHPDWAPQNYYLPEPPKTTPKEDKIKAQTYYTYNKADVDTMLVNIKGALAESKISLDSANEAKVREATRLMGPEYALKYAKGMASIAHMANQDSAAQQRIGISKDKLNLDKQKFGLSEIKANGQFLIQTQADLRGQKKALTEEAAKLHKSLDRAKLMSTPGKPDPAIKDMEDRLKEIGEAVKGVDGLLRDGSRTIADFAKKFPALQGIDKIDAAAGSGGPDPFVERGTRTGRGGSPASRSGNRTGFLDSSQLKRSSTTGVKLIPEAADALDRMVTAARADGVNLGASDGYRSYAAQVDVKNRKPNLAAKPGTSVHGEGRAIDATGGAKAIAWLDKNASRFGYHNPIRHKEDWHWEFKK